MAPALSQSIYAPGSTDKPIKIGTDSTSLLPHINVPPTVVAMGGTLQGAGSRGEAFIDVISGQIRFVDPNPGDAPTASTTFSSFALLDANHNNITSTLTPQQLAAIQAVETSLILVPAPGNNNNGTVAWTYSIEDAKFGFLGPGETLTLTYLAQVETNSAPHLQHHCLGADHDHDHRRADPDDRDDERLDHRTSRDQ